MEANGIIDLRSDTVTKPTKGMLESMWQAEVGDDVFDEDPTVKKLEAKAAALFGMEDALFVASGTMANQICIRLLTRPQQEVICDKLAHIFYYEGGGTPSNSGVSLRFIDGERGRITADQVRENINDKDNIHQPYTAMVAIENTANKGGGSYYELDEIRKISNLCKEHDLGLHLDGARIFNALTETGEQAKAYGTLTDTLSFCLSKGLGAPAGSIVVSSREKIREAKRVRKAFGGAMRQIGYLAAAGIYALDNHIVRLKEDHRLAKSIGALLKNCTAVEEVVPIDTNIVIFKINSSITVPDFLSHLKKFGILAFGFGPQTIRFVTHLDVNESNLEQIRKALTAL